MSQSELLKRVVDVLEASGTPYMLTGSYASSLQGEPRLTHDIDLVVAISQAGSRKLLDAFSSDDFYLDEHAIHEAIRAKTQFNLLQISSGDKVDFWILTDDPFDQSRFSRRLKEEFEGQRLHVSSPEDTIIMKLRWAEMSGGSEKQLGDVRGIYQVQKSSLDLDYIEKWVTQLNLKALWETIIRS